MSPVRTRASIEKEAGDAPKRAADSKNDSKKKALKLDEKGIKAKKQENPPKQEQSQRDRSTDTPQVVETGIFNYFVRGKVEIEEPKTLDEIARGYLILRPLPEGADLTKRPLSDELAARLIALPKKQLPRHTKDRFMAFVDESNMTYEKLSEGFLGPREYATKTAGTRHVPGVTPVGEGVYAIITTENESHLAYITTLPEKIGSFQHDLGFYDRGSFIVSSKNPKFAGPAYARLPTPPEYPKRIMEDFGGYRWIATKPEHLNYKNTQLLLIGHGDKSLLVNGEPTDQEKVESEMEQLEEKDLLGMRHLRGDEAESIFADLHTKRKTLQSLPTTDEAK
ncbi:hypothetical protein PWT90_06349 [Aphanocladium album]|nr:hypothetical protein PWT90_06349 [Aphanocladium album]